jgi:hypothetical protein
LICPEGERIVIQGVAVEATQAQPEAVETEKFDVPPFAPKEELRLLSV